MRKLLFHISLLAVMAFATQKMNAQVSAAAEITAEIVTGLQITKEADLKFGSMFSPKSGGGTATVDVNNQRTFTGVQWATVSKEDITAAQFKVTGSPHATVTITFPYILGVTNTDGTGSLLVVDAGTYNDKNITSPSTLDGSGNLTIKVGATRHVYTNQALGVHENTSDLKITVASN